MVRNFLHILAERDRLAQVPGIAEALRDLINRRRGIITAEVTTAVALDAEMQRLVAQRLANYLNRDPDKVTISSRVDPAIIAVSSPELATGLSTTASAAARAPAATLAGTTR